MFIETSPSYPIIPSCAAGLSALGSPTVAGAQKLLPPHLLRSPLPIVTISLDGARIDVYGRSIARGVGIEGLTRLIREAVAGAQPRMGG